MSFLLPAGGATVAAYVAPFSGDFERSETDSLTWTPGGASTGSGQTFSLSWWLKRESAGQAQSPFLLGDVEPHFAATNKFQWFDPTTALTTTATYEDLASWHHYLLAHDSTLGTAGDRSRFYVDGTEVTGFDADNPIAQNEDTGCFGNGVLITLGKSGASAMDGLMAEMVGIDGLQLTPSSFRDPSSGSPIDLSPLIFGNNGFWMNFASSGDQGNDVSGNGNDFTNSGVTQSSDVPT